jgi:hypothetical protein
MEKTKRLSEAWSELRTSYTNFNNKRIDDKELMVAIEKVIPLTGLNITPIEFMTKYLMNSFSQLMIEVNLGLLAELIEGKIKCKCVRHFSESNLPGELKVEKTNLSFIRPANGKIFEAVMFRKKEGSIPLKSTTLDQCSTMMMILTLITKANKQMKDIGRRWFYNAHYLADDNVVITVCFYCVLLNGTLGNATSKLRPLEYWLNIEPNDYLFRYVSYEGLREMYENPYIKMDEKFTKLGHVFKSTV